MMRTLLLGALIVLSLPLHSQKRTVDVEKSDVDAANQLYTVNGEPFLNTKFVRLVQGTPYYTDEWRYGMLVFENGKHYRGFLKLDLLDNEIHYQDDKKNEFVVPLPVKRILLSKLDSSFETFVHASQLTSAAPLSVKWLLKLGEDSLRLYKYFVKDVSEDRPYNSATYEQRIRTAETYCLYYNDAPVVIRKLKNAPALFEEKKPALEAFIKSTEGKQLSADERMIAFARYLRSLQKK
jgi:hypothetical protein